MEENKKCENCLYYDVYYTRGHNNFYKKDIGLLKSYPIYAKTACFY